MANNIKCNIEEKKKQMLSIRTMKTLKENKADIKVSNDNKLKDLNTLKKMAHTWLKKVAKKSN